MAMPMAATTNSPANTSGMRKLAEACSTSVPIPTLEASVSAITEPTKASVIAIFSEAKKYGIDRGSPTLQMMSQREAPSERSRSSSSGSTVANPVATFTATGKKDSMKAVNTAGTVPMPNHTTSTGTNATFGTELNPISSGYSP